jgi:hypothetical protein
MVRRTMMGSNGAPRILPEVGRDWKSVDALKSRFVLC